MSDTSWPRRQTKSRCASTARRNRFFARRQREIAALVKEVPGVASALVGQRLEAPSIEIETDLAKVEQHGLKPGDVRRAASALLGRIQVGSLFQDQKVFNVVVWGKPEVRNSLTDLLELRSTPRMAAVWRSAISRPCASSRLNS